MMDSAYKTICWLLTLVLCILFMPTCAYMAGVSDVENGYCFGALPADVINAGKDTGYSGNEVIDKDDPHYGWSLGRFFVTGYTRQAYDGNNNPVFLKNVGDDICLWFRLDQDITCLNGDSELIICEDKNGYDEYFGVRQTNFGRGTIIIRHIDHKNVPSDPIIYTDYLAANASQGAVVQVELFEEGDYEIALNYEIKDVGVTAFGEDFLSGYDNYRVYFRFSVRNGNCMVYPFDVVTGSELTNSVTTENGFYLDMALSRYLTVDIKREVMNESRDGLIEDVRFNRPARDGEQYTEEGIYTITVKNEYTQQETVKVIYVGDNDILAAHANSGIPIEQLQSKLAEGEWVVHDGHVLTASTGTEVLVDSSEVDEKIDDVKVENGYGIWHIICAMICSAIVGGLVVFAYARRKYRNDV